MHQSFLRRTFLAGLLLIAGAVARPDEKGVGSSPASKNGIESGGLKLPTPFSGQTPDAPQNAKDKYAPIPAGAIKVPLPDIQQPDDYSCGTAAVMAIISYYGVGTDDYDTLKKRLGTTKKDGSDYQKMVAYAMEVGLDTKTWKGMTLDELDQCLDKSHPVICSIQAYDTDHPKQVPQIYYDRNVNGHFVVAIGRDDKNYYFMDPSLTGRRGFLPRGEFYKRWHDNEGKAHHPDIIQRLGLEIWKDGGEAAYERRARVID